MLGTAAVGTAAAAATGTLPDAAQAKAHNIVAAVPDVESGPAVTAPPRATTPLAGRRCERPQDAAGRGRARRGANLDRAPAGTTARRLDSTAFGRLA